MKADVPFTIPPKFAVEWLPLLLVIPETAGSKPDTGYP
jgi:hypothetical protein